MKIIIKDNNIWVHLCEIEEIKKIDNNVYWKIVLFNFWENILRYVVKIYFIWNIFLSQKI